MAHQRRRASGVVPARLRAGVPAPADWRGRRRGARWWPPNWRLRTKLLVVLLVPLVLAGVLAVLRVSSSLERADDLEKFGRQVGFAQQVAVATHELQRERTLAAAALASGGSDDRLRLEEQIRRVDAALATLRGEPPGVPVLTPNAAAVYRNTRDRIAALPTVRDAPTGSSLPAEAAVITYSSLVDALLELERAVLADADQTLGARVGTALAAGAAKEEISRQHAVLAAALREGELSATAEAAVRAADARFTAALTEFFSRASDDQRQRYGATVTGAEVEQRSRLLDTALRAAAGGDRPDVDPERWDQAAGGTSERLRQVETALLEGLRAAATGLAGTAERSAVRDAVAVAVLVLLALTLLVLVGRSLVRPLRVLRSAAFDVADRRLPETVELMRVTDGRVPDVTVDPMPVASRGEVGQVARAFDAVHGAAVRLAAQQAQLRAGVNDLLVALSRRSESLVERQLELIEQLEDGEQDPGQLSTLFELDHVATRMRRTSANLLVVAGEQRPQHPPGPVPLVDVLRAAAVEVEGYRRVVLRPPPAGSVLPHVVRDLTHLVAELLDNATSCSPPDTTVTVSAARTEPDAVVSVEILDSGPGMSPEQLRSANELLAGAAPEDVTAPPGTGLFVAGRLATRYGIVARLRPRRAQPGVVAVLDVPTECLDPLDPAAQAAQAAWFLPPAADTGGSAPTWTSTADEGWEAAAALRNPVVSGITAAGLPRRDPRARLVPGTAAGTAGRGTHPRDAETVRDRLDSYRRGLQEGRHARRDPA